MNHAAPSASRWPLIAGTVLLLAVLVVGSVLRFAALERRPMHHDEANQALRCEPLLTRGEYRYDPADHHGPTLYYLTAPILRLACGVEFAACTENLLRAVTAAAGLAVVLLVWPLRGALGGGGTLAAMACIALSPGLVFYSRFFIQEMVLVAATMALVVTIWRYAQRPSAWWAVAGGAAAGFMLATKETAVLTFAAFAIALVVVLWGRWRPRWAHLGWAVLAGALVLAVFYSSFGTHGAGLVGLIRAIPFYLNRAGGGDHNHDAWFYGEPLLRYEWPILALAAVGTMAAFATRADTPADLFRRGLAIAALILTGFYLLIPYKTPWCLMTPLALWALMAGQGVAVLAGPGLSRRALAAWLPTVACLVLLTVTAHRLSFVTMGDVRNRWGYVETSRSLLDLVGRMQGLAAIHPQGHALTVAVVSPVEVIWPLPWYLRRFTRVGYWNDPTDVPPGLMPDVVIGAPATASPVAERLGTERATRLFGLRSGVFLSLDCPADLWQRMMTQRRP